MLKTSIKKIIFITVFFIKISNINYGVEKSCLNLNQLQLEPKPSTNTGNLVFYFLNDNVFFSCEQYENILLQKLLTFNNLSKEAFYKVFFMILKM